MKLQSLTFFAVVSFVTVLSGCGQSADTSKSAANGPVTTTPSSAMAPAASSIAAADASKISSSQGLSTDQTTAASAAQDATGSPAAGSPDVGNKAQPAGVDDATISAEVRAAIKAEPVLESQPITVESNNATVTLSGSVAMASLRAQAERIAMSTPGVRNVRNQLAVQPS